MVDEVAAQRFRSAYWHAYRILDSIRLRQWERSQLTLPQLRVLSEARRSPGITVRDLSERLGVTVSTTSGLVLKLIGKGMIERGINAEDRRSSPLFLTAQGQEETGELAELGRAFLGIVGEELGRDLWGITIGLERLSEAAEQAWISEGTD